METAETKPSETAEITDLEKTRQFITFQVTPLEKREITKMAVKDCGISVSEFVRTKIFVTHQKPEYPEFTEAVPVEDEERKIYEDKLREVTNENRKLKDELVKIKVLKTEVSTAEPAPTPVYDVNELVIKLEPEFKAFIDRIKQNRDEKFNNLSPEEQAEFYDFNKFMKLMFFRGAWRSYYNEDLKNSTGLVLSEFKEMAKTVSIDDYYI